METGSLDPALPVEFPIDADPMITDLFCDDILNMVSFRFFKDISFSRTNSNGTYGVDL